METQPTPFYNRPNVKVERLPFGNGVDLGIEMVTNSQVGVGGAYGTWGQCYDNETLPALIASIVGHTIDDDKKMNLSELGFNYRHHVPDLPVDEQRQLEVEVGAHFLRAAAQASGWEPAEVDAVMIGISAPVSENYLEQITAAAGIPLNALKVSVHKACDGSVGALNLALNSGVAEIRRLGRNLAEELRGKKVLVGGIEGLSRFSHLSRDQYALQLFGNAAGVIGVIPGKTLKFLVGKTHEVFDVEGVLKVRMMYPHSRKANEDQSLVEVCQVGDNNYRIAGMMHEPENGESVEMAGPMGMVKLFVRTGVQVVREVYGAYQGLVEKLGLPDKSFAVAIVHHANLKINKLKEKNLEKEGISIPMPWLLTEFGNVSAASNMIAFLRQLPALKPGDHVLIDGFGAGTYYDVLAVEMGG